MGAGRGAALAAGQSDVESETRKSAEAAAGQADEVEIGDPTKARKGPIGEAAADDEPKAQALQPKPPRWPEKEIEIRLSLLDAVRIAFENNFDLRISEADHQMTYHDLVVAQAAFDPFFTMGADFSKNRRPTASFLDLGPSGVVPTVQVNPTETIDYSLGLRGLMPVGTNYNIFVRQGSFDRPAASGLFGINPQVSSIASIQLTQPLLRGAWYRYNTAGIRIARNTRRLSIHQLAQTAADIVYRVEEAYWQLVFSLKNYEAKAKALEVGREDLENARKRLEVGTLAPIDVTSVASQVALRRVDFNDADLLLENARDALLDLINHSGRESLKTRWESGDDRGPYDRMLVIPTTQPEREPLDPKREDALATAFQRRPEYLQLELELTNQRERIAVARSDALPQLNLTGGWDQAGLDDDHGNAYSSLGGGEFYSWSVGVQFEMPLPNRALRHSYLKAESEFRKIQLRRAQLENQIVLDVDQSLRRLESLRRKVQDLEEIVRLQEALLEAERKKLQVGKSIAYLVSTIENDLIGSQSQALQASADYQTAKAEHYRATGTLLDKHRIKVAP